MKVEIGTEAAQFFFWEYINATSDAVCLCCCTSSALPIVFSLSFFFISYSLFIKDIFAINCPLFILQSLLLSPIFLSLSYICLFSPIIPFFSLSFFPLSPLPSPLSSQLFLTPLLLPPSFTPLSPPFPPF